MKLETCFQTFTLSKCLQYLLTLIVQPEGWRLETQFPASIATQLLRDGNLIPKWHRFLITLLLSNQNWTSWYPVESSRLLQKCFTGEFIIDWLQHVGSLSAVKNYIAIICKPSPASLRVVMGSQSWTVIVWRQVASQLYNRLVIETICQ